MDTVLIYSLLATFIVSLLSLAGVISFAIKDNVLKKILLHLVGFAAGSLIGGAFIHLLPEAIEQSNSFNPFIYLLIGIILFYLMERLLHWHHCHEQECPVHMFTYMTLIGDGIHNFIDGLVIVTAFAVDTHLGMITTLVIIFHELPQEISDFGVLVYGGFSKGKALLWNFASAITSVLGAIVGYLSMHIVEGITPFLLSFAAGGFLYISMSDLIPELHKEKKLTISLTHFGFFFLGLLFMYIIKFLSHAH